MKKNNETAYLTPEWPAPPNIRAYSTTRLLGTLRTQEGGDPQATLDNCSRLIKDLQLPHLPLWLNQVHGAQAISLTHSRIEGELIGDAVYTATPNIVCAVQTADCLPILLCNQDGTEVAAIHAGWKGLLNGVIEATLKSLKSDLTGLMAWLGPAIGPKHLELNEEILVDFLDNNPQNRNCFVCIDENRWFADIYKIAALILEQHGVVKIYGGNHCTYQEDQLFFSYRREKLTGRMASLIWISD